MTPARAGICAALASVVVLSACGSSATPQAGPPAGVGPHTGSHAAPVTRSATPAAPPQAAGLGEGEFCSRVEEILAERPEDMNADALREYATRSQAEVRELLARPPAALREQARHAREVDERLTALVAKLRAKGSATGDEAIQVRQLEEQLGAAQQAVDDYTRATCGVALFEPS